MTTDTADVKALTAALALSLTSLLGLAACNGNSGTAVTTTAPDGTTTTQVWDVEGPQNLAIDGFDPVAYFPEGGGQPTQGDPAIAHTTDAGITFHFASDDNRQRFIQDPTKYTPANGAWCAYCLTQDIAYGVTPEAYLIRNNQLLLFYVDDSMDTRQKWLDEIDTQEGLDKAAAGWNKMSQK